MLLVQSTKPIAGIAQTVISATKHLSIQSPVTLAIRAQKNQKKNTLVTLVSIALKVATSRSIAQQATTVQLIELLSTRSVATEPIAHRSHQLLWIAQQDRLVLEELTITIFRPHVLAVDVGSTQHKDQIPARIVSQDTSASVILKSLIPLIWRKTGA